MSHAITLRPLLLGGFPDILFVFGLNDGNLVCCQLLILMHTFCLPLFAREGHSKSGIIAFHIASGKAAFVNGTVPLGIKRSSKIVTINQNIKSID